MWLEQVIRGSARCWPDRTAVKDGRTALTFAELERRSAALAGALRDLGVGRGNRVAVISTNRVEVVETIFALGLLGAANVPLSPYVVPATAHAATAAAGACLFIGEAAALERIGATGLAFESEAYAQATSGPPARDLPDVAADELASIMSTTATTGTAKLVGIDHRHVAAASLSLLAVSPRAGDAVMLVCNPLYHASMFLPLTYLSQGATLSLLRRFTPQSALAAIRRDAVTHLWMVPHMLRFLLRARGLGDAPVTTVREVIHCATPMPPEVMLEARRRLGCEFREVYGMTEALLVTTMVPEDHDFSAAGLDGRTRSVGRIMAGLSVQVRDPLGRPLAQGAVGEICVRGDGVMSGYLDAPEATRRVLEGGWLRTGDRGRIDADGFVYLGGRLKDMINRGGQKIAPAEVEGVLEDHPDVAEATVVGVEDPDWGESPAAFVVPTGGGRLDVDDLLRFCAARLEDYKRPTAVYVVAELPRTFSGKVLRRALRSRQPSEARP